MINSLSNYNIRTVSNKVDPEVHKTKEALQLKEACQQFESILWSKLWKEMKSSAQAIGGHAEGRPWQQMEDLSLEMASDDLVKSSGGAGLWQMLYNSMINKVAADQEAKAIKAADQEANVLYGPGSNNIDNNISSFDAQG
ncbi:MAG: hypothetical protein IJG62_00840 [Synergistaceae bacterium]|nr:hypothetical protein [Synergistaceae bacterium]MBQ3626434.1 hypothetical protein [Synergistaceae bacterium]MBQ6740235.1 hypothetical protein [Synergistaceae bacterium]MBQ6909039.1 hypothetical protein [Synergistaceae bacterium]